MTVQVNSNGTAFIFDADQIYVLNDRLFVAQNEKPVAVFNAGQWQFWVSTVAITPAPKP